MLHPTEQSGIWIPRGIGGETQKLVLKAAHGNSAAGIYWYINGRYLGLPHGNHEMAVLLPGGEHRLTLVDQEGHRNAVSFVVERGAE